MSERQEAAAWHGLATNQAVDMSDRLHAALKALELYERILDESDDKRQAVDPLVAALVEAGQTIVEGSGSESFGIDHPTHSGYWIAVHPDGWPHQRVPVPPGWRLQWIPWMSDEPVPPYKPQRGDS